MRKILLALLLLFPLASIAYPISGGHNTTTAQPFELTADELATDLTDLPKEVVEAELRPFDPIAHDRSVVVVRHVNDEAFGAGVYIGDGLILTVAHTALEAILAHSPWGAPRVVGYNHLEYLIVETNQGTKAVAQVIWKDTEEDLAILKVLRRYGFDATIAQIAEEEPARGDAVHVIGHPAGFMWSYTKGNVIKGATEMGLGTKIYVAAHSTQGGSGGPCFNEKGEVIGVLVAGPRVGSGLLVAPITLFAEKIKEFRMAEE